MASPTQQARLPSGGGQHKGAKVSFMKPFKIYENFRKMTKKNATNIYEVCEPDDMEEFVMEEEYDSVGSSTSSDLGAGEDETAGGRKRLDAALSSLESSECGGASRSPLLLALVTDGNATDDSGIDSICCDSAVSPSGELPGLGTLTEESGGEEEQGQGPGRSFLYNNFAAGAARKPNSSVWKRELLIAGGEVSHEDLCDAGLDNGGVELRSVKTGLAEEGLSALYSAVIKSGKRLHEQPGGDLLLESGEHDRPAGVISKVSLGSFRAHSGPNGPAVLAKDLTSLSDLLATTNNVLHRNSHLRASLTISVKKPSLSRSGSNAAKATSTPKNVRKTPAKSKPSKEKMQKGCVKAEKNLGPRFATLTKDKMLLSTSSPAARRKVGLPAPEFRKASSLARDQNIPPTSSSQQSEPGPTPFVRNYRGKTSGGANGGYRMSMTIQPKTVANLASKFDTIVKEKQPATSKKTGLQGLKLRTYDITKIISELNKLNNEEINQSNGKSKLESGKNPSDPSPPQSCEESTAKSCGTLEDNSKERNPCASNTNMHCLGADQQSTKSTATQGGEGTLTGTCDDGIKPPESTHAQTTVRGEPNNPDKGEKQVTQSDEERSTPPVIEDKTSASSSTSILAPKPKCLTVPPPAALGTGKEARKGLAVSFSTPAQPVVPSNMSAGLASRYLSALSSQTGARRSPLVPGRPSVRETQRLLLSKGDAEREAEARAVLLGRTQPSLPEENTTGVFDSPVSGRDSSSNRRKYPQLATSNNATNSLNATKTTTTTSATKPIHTTNVTNAMKTTNTTNATNTSSNSEPHLPKVHFKIGSGGEVEQEQNSTASASLHLEERNNNRGPGAGEGGNEGAAGGGSRLPNSSFLWTRGQAGREECGQWPSRTQQDVGEGSVLDDTDFYDDVGVSNYQLVNSYEDSGRMDHAYMDIASARYLEIGSGKSLVSSVGSYDDIQASSLLAPSSSRIYLSADNLSLVQYDDIKAQQQLEDEDNNSAFYDDDEQLHSSALVTATPCVVLEEQTDSLSYVYDDIGRRGEEQGDLGLYESIAGSLLNLARSKAGGSMEDLYELGLVGGPAAHRRHSSFSQRSQGPHEVVSYSLADMRQQAAMEEERDLPYSYMDTSLRGSIRSSAPSLSAQKSVTSESSEWVDIETDFEDYEEKPIVRHVHFVRSSVRASNKRKFSRGSARLGQGWNRAVRDVLGTEQDQGDDDDPDDLYESIYEVIRPPTSESDFEEVLEDDDKDDKTSNLTKIAEAAGRKMKKLKTNWSMKKNDITRSLSKIKRTKADNPESRRKLVRRLSSNGGGGSPGGLGLELPDDDTMFYITLTIEEEGKEPINITTASSGDSDLDSNTYSHLSTDSSTGHLGPHHTPHRRKTSSCRTPYSVVRPMVPPPAPPANKPHLGPSSSSPLPTRAKHQVSSSPSSPFSSSTSSMSGPGEGEAPALSQDSLLPCDSLKEFYIGLPTTDLEHLLPELEETYTSSLFMTEPLYQFYDNKECETAEGREQGQGKVEENMYESVDNLLQLPHVRVPKTSRCSAMDIIISATGRRSLWAELPEVIDSGILATIRPEEKKLQEAMFEVISSEASYLKSLNILISHFIQSPKFSGDSSVLSKRDQRILFSEVILVRACSERFLSDLESRWQESVRLTGISDIIRNHAKENFQVYVKYCSNQVYQDRTLKRLKVENPKFVEALRELEGSAACQSLAMHSFLMLPMQRITRLPLLTDAIHARLPLPSPELPVCREAMELLNSLVQECNDSATSMERMEELLILSQQLDFRDVRAIPLISASRWLVKRGDCLRLSWKETGGEKLTFGRRVHKQNLALFLFTDLLVVAKRKSEERFVVLDYSPRNMIQVSELESSEGVPGMGGGDQGGFALWLTLLQNHEHKTQEMLLSFPTESARGRWMAAVTPAASQVEGEKIYEDWDCPKVEAVSPHRGVQEDEMTLAMGETANVLKKTSDGWLYVERCRDGAKGWIPKSYCREIESEHVRARNFKQRYLFLKALTEDPTAATNPLSSLAAGNRLS